MIYRLIIRILARLWRDVQAADGKPPRRRPAAMDTIEVAVQVDTTAAVAALEVLTAKVGVLEARARALVDALSLPTQ